MRDRSWLPTADRASPWSSLRVLVAGAGRSGEAAARVLVTLGAEVVVVDDRAGGRQQEDLLVACAERFVGILE